MSVRRAGLAVVVLLVSGLLLTLGTVAPLATAAASSSPVTGSVTGPSVLAFRANAHLSISGTGGPAFAANGTRVGNLTYYASIIAADTTGVSIVPAQSAIILNQSQSPLLTVGSVAETVTVAVMLSSVYHHENVSTNLTYSVTVVQPYVVAVTIVNPGNATVLAFPVAVDLDGSPIGSVAVPTLTPGGEYNLSYQYATLGLSTGDHTFSISLASEHGLVKFVGGATVYSETFYVTGPPPSYTLWYAAGGVAFVGVLFIFMTRVAARRRGTVRK